MSDAIGDMLTRIRNANATKADQVEIPFSELKGGIARILKREGFVRDFITEGGGTRKVLRIYLKYAAGRAREGVIRDLQRVSRPGLRRYVKAAAMRSVKHGTGIAIVSTSAGLMTDREVRQANAGGEWLCSVW